MKKKMLAVAVCVSMCMMAFAGCTSESGGGSDKKAEQTEGKKEESGKVFMTVSNQQNELWSEWQKILKRSERQQGMKCS